MSWPNDSYGHSLAAKLGHYKKKLPTYESKKEREKYLKGIKEDIKKTLDEIDSNWEVGETSKTNKDIQRALDKAIELYGTKYKEKINSVHKPGEKVALVCSTLITEMFPDFGFDVTLKNQLNNKCVKEIKDESNLKRGDLVFFKYDKDKSANHVGIISGFTGKSESRQTWFLHASESKGVILSRLGEGGGRNLGTKEKPKYKPWSSYVTGYRRARQIKE